MFSFSKFSKWLSDFFREDTCELSEDLYNDVIPSGIQRTTRPDEY